MEPEAPVPSSPTPTDIRGAAAGVGTPSAKLLGKRRAPRVAGFSPGGKRAKQGPQEPGEGSDAVMVDVVVEEGWTDAGRDPEELRARYSIRMA